MASTTTTGQAPTDTELVQAEERLSSAAEAAYDTFRTLAGIEVPWSRLTPGNRLAWQLVVRSALDSLKLA